VTQVIEDEGSSGLFTPGPSLQVPEGDPERQAVASLRGYTYQTASSAVAWLDLNPADRLYLEVAEDYAIVAAEALRAVQVKDTAGSGSATLNVTGVRSAIAAYVDLVDRNPGRAVSLHYLTTSPIGEEARLEQRPGGEAGLAYWRKAAMGADVAPLRNLLEGEGFPEPVRAFVRARDDETLRSEFLQRVHWDCGQPNLSAVTRELEERLIVVGRDRYGIPAAEARRLADSLMHHVLKKTVLKEPSARVLDRAELDQLVDRATRIQLSRGDVDKLIRIISSSGLALSGTTGADGATLSPSDREWLVADKYLPTPRLIVRRTGVEAQISSVLTRHGFVILTGGTGLGKSLLARSVARDLTGGFVIAEFRDMTPAETRYRLNLLLGRLGEQSSGTIIFEDLNHLDNAELPLSLGQVRQAMQRRDRPGILTCYRVPSDRPRRTWL
jgi:hypothetical protein